MPLNPVSVFSGEDQSKIGINFALTPISQFLNQCVGQG
jgi:hypothetical protein